ncbi:MAG: PHB depolymerase family esterase [Polyangiaceae bacterium]
MPLSCLTFAVSVVALAACSSASSTPGAADAGDASVPPEETGGPGADGSVISDAGVSPETSADASAFASRPYKAIVPKDYDVTKPIPLVLSLHGFSVDAELQERYLKFKELADAKTFLVAEPDGTKDEDGNRFWNASPACCNFYGNDVDDVAYLTWVIDDMASKYAVDPKRVFVFGHSNGGFMAHRLACERSSKIAAIVSLAGAAPSPPVTCTPDTKVAVLQVHGTADDTIAYDGGVALVGFPAHPGAKESVAFWAAKNGCDGALVETGTKIDITQQPGSETTVARHACPNGGGAELWSIDKGTHIPVFAPGWNDALWEFYIAHPKP